MACCARSGRSKEHVVEIAFLVCVAALVYTFAGYPLLIALWARLRPRPVRRASNQPRVAIIVVAHNEEAHIAAKLRTCLAQDYAADRLRVIIAADGSADRTKAIVEAFGHARVQLLAFPARRGKAACLNDAVAACSEEVLVFTDARQALDPGSVRSLVESLADPAIGAVSGELIFVCEDMSPFAQGVDAYWRYEKFIRQREALVHSAPGVTGALYAIRRSCYRPIPDRTILDDVAIPMQAVRAGYRVVFDSRAIAYDKPSQTPAQEKLRKVRTLAGNYQLIFMMPWLLLPIKNPIFLQYVSHKLLRLLAPFAMLAVLVLNAFLIRGSVFYSALMAAQVLCYTLVLAAARSPSLRNWRLVKLGSAFLLLNWYAVLGLVRFLSDRDAHLWQVNPGKASEQVSG